MKTYLKKNNERKLLKFGEGYRHESPGSTESQTRWIQRGPQRHIIIKMPKVKDKVRISKAAREKQKITYKGFPIRLSTDFSKETLQARRD